MATYKSDVPIEPVVRTVNRDGYYAVIVPDVLIATDQARGIVKRHLPAFLELFLAKNRKYRRVGNSLGARGVFPDVHRKVGILKDRIWDQSDVYGEPTVEVIDDLIGHLLLMRYMLTEPTEEGAEGPTRPESPAEASGVAEGGMSVPGLVPELAPYPADPMPGLSVHQMPHYPPGVRAPKRFSEAMAEATDDDPDEDQIKDLFSADEGYGGVVRREGFASGIGMRPIKDTPQS
jgi:hypothetical protein